MTKQYLKMGLLSLATAILLAGCSGAETEDTTNSDTNTELNDNTGSTNENQDTNLDGDNSTNNENDTTNEIEVERGKVFQATVQDSSTPMQTATQQGNTNIYVFANTPIMPITASGGWIDVNGDGNMSDEDVENDFNLSSYSYVVTPLTTYLGDTNSTEGKARVEKLMTDMNISEEDLTKVPSESSTNGIAIQNALYKVMKTKGTALLTADDLKDVNSSFNDIKHAIATNPELIDVTAIAKFAEKDVMDILKSSGKITLLTEAQIEHFKDALSYMDGNQSLEEELAEAALIDASPENKALSKHNYISIFHNITEEEKLRIEGAVCKGTSPGSQCGGLASGDGSTIVDETKEILSYYELNRETTCVSIGGFYDEEGSVTTTKLNGITKKVYKLQDKDHNAYCTEYINTTTSEVYGAEDYAISYYKYDVNASDLYEPTKFDTLSDEDLAYENFVMIYTNEYTDGTMCTADNSYQVATGTYTCDDFTNTTNCFVGNRDSGSGMDCITLSSDSFGGSTK